MRFRYLVLLILCLVAESAWALGDDRDASGPQVVGVTDPLSQLRQQVHEMQASLEEMRAEIAREHAATLQLKQELQATRCKIDGQGCAKDLPEPASPTSKSPPSPDSVESGSIAEQQGERRLSKVEEEQQWLAGMLRDRYQTTVESASKYRVKLSGLLLLNLFSNKGYVDHFEIPGIALPATSSLTGGNSGGSFGGTVRQSQLGLEVYGPNVAGAKTQGKVVADFLGDFPDTFNGFSAGTLRLRTGTIRLDWPRTSIVAGQDDLFFSPMQPTSVAALGNPPLSYAGNMWAWTPQLRVEHLLISSEDSTVKVSAGILDPLTGEIPTNEFLRAPGAGESSRQPGYAGRVSWTRKVFGQPLTLGSGGYYSRQNWGLNHTVNGWAGITDWMIPLGEHFSTSGTFYRGEAIGGFGAGVGRSVLVNGPLDDPATRIRAAEGSGGWAQLKYKATAKLEFNAAAGQDGMRAGDLRGYTFNPQSTLGPLVSYFPSNLVRNRGEFVNFIYRPRSDLLFSAEWHRLRTFTIDGNSDRAHQINLSMGILF